MKAANHTCDRIQDKGYAEFQLLKESIPIDSWNPRRSIESNENARPMPVRIRAWAVPIATIQSINRPQICLAATSLISWVRSMAPNWRWRLGSTESIESSNQGSVAYPVRTPRRMGRRRCLFTPVCVLLLFNPVAATALRMDRPTDDTPLIHSTPSTGLGTPIHPNGPAHDDDEPRHQPGHEPREQQRGHERQQQQQPGRRPLRPR